MVRSAEIEVPAIWIVAVRAKGDPRSFQIRWSRTAPAGLSSYCGAVVDLIRSNVLRESEDCEF